MSAPAVGYRNGVRAVLPIATTVWFFGASFGLLARAAGLGVLAPLVMSATTFAGSAQFAAISILSVGGTAAAAVVAAVFLNARYAPISISVAPLFRGSRLRRLAESQLIVDESWALSSRGEGRFDKRILIGAGVVLYLAWVSGTAVGVLGGQALGDPKELGLDGAFPALFLALLATQLRSRLAVAAALLGAALALADSSHSGRRPHRRRQRRLPARPPERNVSAVWTVVVVVGAATIVLKACGPVLVGGRRLPAAVAGVVALLAPVLLAALVVTQTVGGDNELVLDARVAGVAVAGLAIALRVPLLVVVIVAAAATALARLVA